MSEIEPHHSVEWLKRKFLQKLRKDIRERITIGITSTLPDLLQRAIAIETNIAQQKIDDRLRDAHKDDKAKSTTLNNISAGMRPGQWTFDRRLETGPMERDTHPIITDNSHTTTDPSSASFPTAFSSRLRSLHSQPRLNTQPPPQTHQGKSKSRDPNRFCSFCWSASHSWLYCYFNPDGLNYWPEYYQQFSLPSSRQQQQQHQQYQQTSNQPPRNPMLPPHCQNQQQRRPPPLLPPNHTAAGNANGSRS
jgi:hypothetical protein